MKYLSLLVLLVCVSCGGGGGDGLNNVPMFSPDSPKIVLDQHNKLFNKWEYHYPTEDNYGSLDFKIQGSCLAYAKRLEAICASAGFPISMMKVTTCMTPDVDHAVLIAQNDDGEWFLFEVSGDSGPLHWFPGYVWWEKWVQDEADK